MLREPHETTNQMTDGTNNSTKKTSTKIRRSICSPSFGTPTKVNSPQHSVISGEAPTTISSAVFCFGGEWMEKMGGTSTISGNLTSQY